jgi:hypothetical protein
MIAEQTKARIFGLYLGCPVMDVDEPAKRLYLSDVSYHRELDMAMATVANEDDIEDWWPRNNLDYIKLLLSPLRDLTEEDGNAIAKMCGGVWLKKDDNFWQIVDKDNQVPEWFILNEYLPMKITDFLRSRYYALPYMGIDLFGSGIAMVKPKKESE